MKYLLFLSLLATLSVAQAQPTLRIGASTRVLGSGSVRLVYGGGSLTNAGSLSLPAGQLTVNGPATYGGAGAATVANALFSHNMGTTTLNSLLSVTGRATLSANTALNANGQLYLRTDQFPTADMVNNGLLTGTVQGLLTRATLTTGATPYSSNLSVNMSGTSVRYQWQSSPNGSAWTDVSGATSATYQASVNAPTYYRCRLTSSTTAYDQPTPAVLLDYTGVVASPASQTVCRSSRVVLNSALTGTSYQWFRGSVSVANRLSDVAGVQTGTRTASLTLVSVQTTANYFCVATTGTVSQTAGPFNVTVNFGCTAPGARLAAEPEVALQVSVAPNPLDGEWLRATVTGAGGQGLQAQLVNERGYPVQAQQWPQADEQQRIEWDLTGRPGGLYLLQITSGTQRQTLKVIKP